MLSLAYGVLFSIIAEIRSNKTGSLSDYRPRFVSQTLGRMRYAILNMRRMAEENSIELSMA